MIPMILPSVKVIPPFYPRYYPPYKLLPSLQVSLQVNITLLTGRTVRVRVKKAHFSLLLKLAVEYGFDWVYYASSSYIRLSVIPDGKYCNRSHGPIRFSRLQISRDIVQIVCVYLEVTWTNQICRK